MANSQSSQDRNSSSQTMLRKMLRRASAFIFIVALLLPVISLAGTQAAWADDNPTGGAKAPVPYVDSAGNAYECTNYTNTSALGSGEWTLNEGWYVVDKSATGNPGIRVRGDVNLILCDGITLPQPAPSRSPRRRSPARPW